MDDISHARYVRCKNDLRRLTRNLRKDFERRLASNLKENPKGFWRYAGSRMKTTSGVENLRSADGTLTTNDCEKATTLNDFFNSVCVMEPPGEIPEPNNTYHGPAVTDIDLTVELVRKKTAALRPFSAAGPDGVHPRIIKETADSLASTLTSIYRSSLDTGTLPQDWKLADVVPIYKKGSKDEPGNYRPEDLDAALHWADRWQLAFNPGKCKVLHIGGGSQHHTYRMGGTTVAESDVERDLGVLMDTQLKFRKQAAAARLKVLQLPTLYYRRKRGDMIAVYQLLRGGLDMDPRNFFEMAADRTPATRGHQWRLAKPRAVSRIRRNAFSIRVINDWNSLPPLMNPIGTYQGSALGPLLYNIYSNDLPLHVDGGPTEMIAYADDVQLFVTGQP
ncbi:uncharacterized protein LOC122369049, partial [Amphibalanus amphitrite]|uniref:uncharacterized protein LOC122369049 n=1 Tax=Amphibalanus amphitrite TaxID=1232801 RepID=UPI001C92A6B8